MSESFAIIEGVVTENGTLELSTKLSLPAGRVQVTVSSLPQDDPFWKMLQGIWEGQKARGHVPRSAEEVEAERRATRQDWEDRMQAIQAIREEASRLRENAQ